MAIKVLTIDDESSFTSLIRMNLEREGEYEVLEENDPTYALESAKEFAPDVILLDMVMPGMTGSEVADQIRTDPDLQGTPVILMTALVSQHESGEEEIFVPNIQKILPKPVNLTTLKDALLEVTSVVT